jgi:hypothetical protein
MSKRAEQQQRHSASMSLLEKMGQFADELLQERRCKLDMDIPSAEDA